MLLARSALRAVASRLQGQARRSLRCLPAGCAGMLGCLVLVGMVVVAVGGAIVAAVAGTIGAPATDCAGSCRGVAQPPLQCPSLTVSQGFGDTPWEHPHTGIDLVCPAGTPVHALLSGVLHDLNGGQAPCGFPAGAHGGLGVFAAIVSGGITVYYGHLESFALSDGALVAAGETIGREGATGCATGPHLHLQVDVGTQPVDPCPYLPAAYPAAHTLGGRRCWGPAPP